MTAAAPGYTASDFLTAMLHLMPFGPIWPRDQGAVMSQVLGGLAPSFARLTDRAADLLQDAPVGALVEKLPEWEATFGLPDPCAGEQPTIAQRQASVAAAIAARGGQSIPYFTAVAAALGYTITVTEFAPARADALLADGPVYDPGWAYAWQVNVAGLTPVYFLADAGRADEPLVTWGGDVLECTLRRIAPAHTVLFFAYSGPLAGAGWDTAPGWDAGGWA